MSSSSSTSQTEEHPDSANSESTSRSRSSSGSSSESETPVPTERLPVEGTSPAPEVHPAAGNEIQMTPLTSQRKRPDTRGLGSVPGVRGFASPMIGPSGERGGRDSLEGRESIDTDFQEDIKPAAPAGRK